MEENKIKWKNTKWYKRTYGALIAKWVYIKRHNLYKNNIRLEKHHIIPKCIGGTNDENNLVGVPIRVHIILHQLLSCIYPEKEGIIYASNMMMSTRDGKLPNTKIAAWTREQLSILRKEHAEERLAAARKVLTGRKRSQKEKENISNGKLKAYKRMSAEDRLKMSTPRHAHSEKSRKAISDANKKVMKRKTREDLIVVGRRIIGPGGVKYKTIREASETLGIPHTTISYYLKNNLNGYRYLEPDPNKLTIKPIQGPDGTIYKSLRECSRETGHTVNTLRKWAKENPEMGYRFIF